MKKSTTYLLLLTFIVLIQSALYAKKTYTGADIIQPTNEKSDIIKKSNGYKNPIISGFHPDPSVCRVNDNYYLVTSSFEYFPGVPVFHSKDLINWTQIGHCLTRESQLKLHGAPPSAGIYAPTIRHHDGRFYMVTTNVSDKGNFYVHTDDPAGEWSDPIWVKQGGIDPTLFFDNGKCYFLSIPDGIQICEIDLVTGQQLSESRVLWRGTGGRYPEAPHLYKKDGWYYLLIAEGGTEYGHKVTIARSRDLYGPYQENPANPILTHIDQHTQTSPIQGIGHADLIEAHDGSWWTVFLGFRPQTGTHHLLGRETFLAPVRWDTNAWPVINGNGSVSLDMDCPTLPQIPVNSVDKRNNFNDTKLGFEWNYLRNPDKANYSLTERKGYLRLKPTSKKISEFASPAFVGRRQQDINFTATTSLEFSPVNSTDEAGITVFMRNNFHYDLYITQINGDKSLMVRYHLGNMQHIEKSIPLTTNDPIFLRVTGDNNEYSFSYSIDEKEYHLLAKMNTSLLSTETAGGFTGIYLGLYATSNQPNSLPNADFDWFEYEGKE